jgi:hypothetical protein
MPRLLPGSPGVLFEVGLSSKVPPRTWFRNPPPRGVDVVDLIRTSYGSSTGKGLVGLGLLLGVPLLVIGLVAMATDPWQIVTATLGGLFTTVLVVVPSVPALRFARALRLGVIDHATIVAARNAARGGVRIIDRRGRDIPYDPVMMWRTKLRAGADIELLVDPARDRVLWILGPAGDDDNSRTMPGQ